MKWLLLIFVLSCFSAQAQTFPEPFIGHWKGELLWYQTGKTTPQKVAMELHIQPTDTAQQFTWQLVYGKPGEDSRPYILKPVDTAKGHWAIDERNGIVLNQYWIGGQFCGSFTVQTSTITNCYRIEDGKLLVEFITTSAKPASITGGTAATIPAVDSYAVKGYQKAVLVKQTK